MPSTSRRTIAQTLDRTLAEITPDVIEDSASLGRAVPSVGRAMRQGHKHVAVTGRRAMYYDDPAADLVVRMIPGNYSRARGELATRVRGEVRAALAHHRPQAARRRQPGASPSHDSRSSVSMGSERAATLPSRC